MSNGFPLMPQAGPQDLEGSHNSRNTEQGMSPPFFDLFPLIPQTCIVDDYRDQPQSTSNQPTPNPPLGQGESDCVDSSRLLYFMYSKIAGAEDSKIVENCSKEADGTLIFVSRHICL